MMSVRDFLDNLQKLLVFFSDYIDKLDYTHKSGDNIIRLRETHNACVDIILRLQSARQEFLDSPADSLMEDFIRKLIENRQGMENGKLQLTDIEKLLLDLQSHTSLLPEKLTTTFNVKTIPPSGGKTHTPIKRSKETFKMEKPGKEYKKGIKTGSILKMTQGMDDMASEATEKRHSGGISYYIENIEMPRLEAEAPLAPVPEHLTRQNTKAPGKLMPKRRVVNTGFAFQNNPDNIINREMPLKTGEQHYFWLEIGEPLIESIEETPVEIPLFPAKTRLTVAVFGFKDGLITTPGSDVGELEMQENGSVLVTAQPCDKEPAISNLRNRRLFFPVRCPESEGIFRMRCNIYREQVLLQSRIIYAQVMNNPARLAKGEKALRSVLDYTLSATLDPTTLNQMTEHRLSILVNGNENGTNSLHIYGSKGEVKFKQDDIRFGENELNDFIEEARGSLKIASWGNDREWKDQETTPFIYQDKKRDIKRLSEDLISMAQWGREFYIQFKIEAEFEEVLFEPGAIQIAMKDSPSHIFPAAMIYDYPLDDLSGGITICPSFEDAFDRGAALEDHECFKGNCPSRKNKKVVCPSGFWGFRHYLGMPLSVESKKEETGKNKNDLNGVNGTDMPAHILYTDNMKMIVAAATNLSFYKSHEETLAKLNPNLVYQHAYTRDAVLSLLQSSPHLVYFYCHGGLIRNRLAYLQIGENDKIPPAYFDEVRWVKPRPLVFMNGCHTIDPLIALNFIKPLVMLSKCAGVIGTEITIYEEMATVFAEEFFRRFLKGETIGMAIRNARLKLLEEGNPLGLAYIPYAMAGLNLLEQPANP